MFMLTKSEDEADSKALSFKDTPEWNIVQQICESSVLARSAKLRLFLEYIAERAIERRPEEINEQQIGIHVFRRGSDYSPGEDSIVRSQARLLRAKLDAYYEVEGRSSPIRINIPKGGYIPVFEDVSVIHTQKHPDSSHIKTTIQVQNPENLAEVSQHPNAGRRWTVSNSWALLSCSLLLIAVTGVLAVQNWNISAYKRRPTHLFWKTMFSTQRPTMVVIGDSGLAIYNDLVKRPVSLTEYTSGSYLRDLESAPESVRSDALLLTGRRYVSTVDMELTNRLSVLPEAEQSTVSIQYARDVKQDDLYHSNVVLIGTRAVNPWLSLFWGNLDFVVQRNYESREDTIVNRRPRNGEQAVYTYTPTGPGRAYYCTISFDPPTKDSGSRLLVQGTTMHGIHTCSSLIFDDDRWKNVLSAATSSGEIRSFEVLMRSQASGPGDREGQILAFHLH